MDKGRPSEELPKRERAILKKGGRGGERGERMVNNEAHFVKLILNLSMPDTHLSKVVKHMF